MRPSSPASQMGAPQLPGASLDGSGKRHHVLEIALERGHPDLYPRVQRAEGGEDGIRAGQQPFPALRGQSDEIGHGLQWQPRAQVSDRVEGLLGDGLGHDRVCPSADLVAQLRQRPRGEFLAEHATQHAVLGRVGG